MLASGPLAQTAAAFYLTAYFITTLGAFGVVTLLSDGARDADSMDDYRGLVWKRPWIGGIFTAMLFSLAGIPLTAGFVGKFYVVAAGVGSALWMVIVVLAINSVIGLFYYLRIIVVLFTRTGDESPVMQRTSRIGSLVLAVLTILLVWLGTYPGPLLDIIKETVLF